jgi:hypothetical protein
LLDCRMNTLLALAHSTASWSSHLNNKDSPTRLRIFMNQPEKKRKDSAGSDDTASMIEGGGLHRCPHQATPHRANNQKEMNVGQRGCVP